MRNQSSDINNSYVLNDVLEKRTRSLTAKQLRAAVRILESYGSMNKMEQLVVRNSIRIRKVINNIVR